MVSQGGRELGSRYWIVAALYAVAAALVADLAWATAIGTSGPWFSPAISVQIYSLALLLGAVVGIVLAAAASARVVRLNDQLEALDARIAALRDGPSSDRSELYGAGGLLVGREDEDVADVLHVLRPGGPPVVEMTRGERAVGVSQEVVRLSGAVADTKRFRDLVAARGAVRTARARVWPAASGPIGMSVVILAVAGAMLPGSEGFAVRNFQLNTMFILAISYSWWLLVAWAVTALFLMHRLPSPRDSA